MCTLIVFLFLLAAVVGAALEIESPEKPDDRPHLRIKHDLPRLRVIGKLALDDDAQTAPTEQYIGPFPALNLNGLGIGLYAKTGQRNGELGIEGFFAVTVDGHCCVSQW